MITAVCVHVWGYALLHAGYPAPALLLSASQENGCHVALSASLWGFSTKSLAEVRRRKKYSSLILYGKTQGAMGEIS